MYEYILITINNPKTDDNKIIGIDEHLCYFNNYSSDYMLMDEEEIVIKPFDNPIFANKYIYKIYENENSIYDYFQIILKHKVEDVNIIKYIMDKENDYMIVDKEEQIIKDFNSEVPKVKTIILKPTDLPS